jgi:superfamily II DNA/RNA helicase
MSNTFESLGVASNLVEGLKKSSITVPTDIQTAVIPAALQNKDIIGQSQTGSGKTLAYLLPIFHKIDAGKREMQAIILAPTHELVMQIDKVISTLSQNSGAGVTSTTIIGDVNIKRQIEKLKEKPHIIVGSTVRILELIKQKKISAHTVKTIVLDEADRLLKDESLPSVKDVIKTTLRERQLMVFSASVDERTLKTAEVLMKEPEIIKLEQTFEINPNISHMFIVTEERDKLETLRKAVAAEKPEKAIVFLNRGEDIEVTTLKLQYHHFKCYGLYGNATKEERKKALEDFRNGKLQLLIASDLGARGLDVKGVTHIFNLSLPRDSKEYLHRVGRTGRAGEKGKAISIVTKREMNYLKDYEKHFNISVEEKELFKGQLLDPLENKAVSQKTFGKSFGTVKKNIKKP